MTKHTSAVRDQRKTAVALIAGLSALLMLAWLTVGQTRAAFTDTTDNPGNFFTTGSVEITADGAGAAWFDASALDLLPGNSVTGTIAVSNGSPVPLGVRLFAEDIDSPDSEIANALHMLVTVNGTNGGTVFDGTLAEFASADSWNNGCWVGHTPGTCGSEPAEGAPSTPTVTNVTAGDQQITVNYTASTANGTPVTGYTAECTDGTTPVTEDSEDESNDPITVTGLTNGTEYTCRVKAKSTAGDSAWSAPSGAVTPRGTLETVLFNTMTDDAKTAVEPTPFWTIVRAADSAARAGRGAAEGAGQAAQDAVDNAPTPQALWDQVRPELEDAGVPTDALEQIDSIVATLEGDGGAAAQGESASSMSAEDDDRVAPKDMGDTLQAENGAGSSRTYTFTITMDPAAGSSGVEPTDNVTVTFVWEGRA